MLILTLALLGCNAGPYAAPYGSTLIMPNDETFSLDVGYSQPDDGIGGLIQTSVGVLIPSTDFPSSESSAPGNNIRVEVTSGWSGAYLIPEEAVRIIDDYEVDCEGRTDDETDPCHAWYDNESEQYVEFGGDYTDLDGFKPTYLMGATNNRGYLDFYVFVDSVPLDNDGNAVSIPIFASIEVEIDSFNITFTGGGSSSE